MTSGKNGKNLAIILAILTASILLKTVIWWHLASSGQKFNTSLYDSVVIQGASKDIKEVLNPLKFQDNLRPPGYHLFLAIIRAISGGGNFLAAAWLLQLILSTIMAYLTYLIAKNMYSERTAVIACTMAAFYPTFIAYSFTLLTEPLFAFFATLVFYRTTLQPKLMSMKNTMLTGFLAGMMTMIRVVTLLYIPLLGLWFAWLQRRDRKKALKHLAAFFATSLVIIAPWSAAMSYRYGDIVLITQRGISNVIGQGAATPEFRADGDLVEFMSLDSEKEPKTIGCTAYTNPKNPGQKSDGVLCYAKELTRITISDPSWTISKFHRGIKYFFMPDFIPIKVMNRDFHIKDGDFLGQAYAIMSISYAAVLLLALAGLSRIKRRQMTPAETIILLFMAYIITVHLLTLSAARYRMPITPFIMVFAAKALENPYETVRRLFKPSWKNAVLLAAMIYLTAFLFKQTSFTMEIKMLNTPSQENLEKAAEKTIETGRNVCLRTLRGDRNYVECITRVAIKTRDPGVCNWTRRGQKCLKKVAEETRILQICRMLAREGEYNECVRNIEKSKNRPEE